MRWSQGVDCLIHECREMSQTGWFPGCEWPSLEEKIRDLAAYHTQPEDIAKYSLKELRGVLVRQVVAGQPADQGGMRANDVILGVDGTRIEEPRDLQRIIASTPVGEIVKLSVIREGKPTELSVTVGVYQGGGRVRGPAPAPSR